jgi:hypothetical protein
VTAPATKRPVCHSRHSSVGWRRRYILHRLKHFFAVILATTAARAAITTCAYVITTDIDIDAIAIDAIAIDAVATDAHVIANSGAKLQEENML